MKNGSKLYLVIVLIAGFVALWGCPKKTDVSSSPDSQTQSEKGSIAPASDASSTAAKSDVKAEEQKKSNGISAEGLKSVYFDYDRSSIRSDATSAMKTNASWLKANPKVMIKIEGNCDERGTAEYNQALGQRRATAAKKYLTDMGISANRITLISFGKEKPVCNESDEACWQKNRRDDFVVVSQ